jgi:hypothetical protein
MCFMDWRIGRLIRSRTTSVASDGNGRIVLPANQQRVGLSVWGEINNDVLILDPSNSMLTGAVGTSASPFTPIHITIATHGDLPMQKITILDLSGGGNTITYTEYFAPERMLTLGLEQVMHQYPQ